MTQERGIDSHLGRRGSSLDPGRMTEKSIEITLRRFAALGCEEGLSRSNVEATPKKIIEHAKEMKVRFSIHRCRILSWWIRVQWNGVAEFDILEGMVELSEDCAKQI